eukprot:11015893-Lingulodinium_polyedra.AAC.1
MAPVPWDVKQNARGHKQSRRPHIDRLNAAVPQAPSSRFKARASRIRVPSSWSRALVSLF